MKGPEPESVSSLQRPLLTLPVWVLDWFPSSPSVSARVCPVGVAAGGPYTSPDRESGNLEQSWEVEQEEKPGVDHKQEQDNGQRLHSTCSCPRETALVLGTPSPTNACCGTSDPDFCGGGGAWKQEKVEDLVL